MGGNTSYGAPGGISGRPATGPQSGYDTGLYSTPSSLPATMPAPMPGAQLNPNMKPLTPGPWNAQFGSGNGGMPPGQPPQLGGPGATYNTGGQPPQLGGGGSVYNPVYNGGAQMPPGYNNPAMSNGMAQYHPSGIMGALGNVRPMQQAPRNSGYVYG
jgi:hypothetical protein